MMQRLRVGVVRATLSSNRGYAGRQRESMRFPSARIWLVLGCAGCAQLAGFEDLSGAGAESSGGASGGITSTGGTSPGGGRTGGSGPVQSAGSSDGGDSSSVDGGAAGDASGGRDPVTGGRTNGGSSASGNGNSGGASGGSANGGAATGGTASGGTATGGTASGGTATGGTASGACGELLLNGDFANADSGWTVDSDYLNFERDVHPIITARDESVLLLEDVEPHSDDYLAWVGGVPNDDRGYRVSFSQTVIIPEDVTELAFTGFIRIQTDEPDDDLVYDRVFLELWDAEDPEEEEFVWQFTAQSNQQAGDAWVEIDPTDPDPSDLSFIRGRTLSFRGYSLTDAEGPTHFFFDSLSLIATCDE
jgi:hypothetical protein